MIQQLNTIDDDAQEFEVEFYDTLETWKGWKARCYSLRNDSWPRPYWYRCSIWKEEEGNDQPYEQHFFAPTYPALKAQLINFIAMFWR